MRETSWGFKSPLAHDETPAQQGFLRVWDLIASHHDPDASFFTELLRDPDVWELTDSPKNGDTVYLLVANYIGIRDTCSDGSYPQVMTSLAALGDELDTDSECLGPAVEATDRGYCLLPLTASENGTRLRFEGTLSGTHTQWGTSTPASQTVSIDLRKIVAEP